MLERTNIATKSYRGKAAAGGLFRPLRKRQHPRIAIPLEGKVSKGDKRVPCRLRNISAGGALIEMDAGALFEAGSTLRVGQPLEVEIPEIGKLKACPTRMHWKFAALSFEDGSEVVGAFIKQWLDGDGRDRLPN